MGEILQFGNYLALKEQLTTEQLQDWYWRAQQNVQQAQEAADMILSVLVERNGVHDGSYPDDAA